MTALHVLDWSHSTCPDDIRESPAYFETRQSKMNYGAAPSGLSHRLVERWKVASTRSFTAA
jgi:hypothetical protein